jgi:hypothetical protein
VTEVTAVTEVTEVTQVTGVTEVTQVTEVTEVTQVTGVTEVTQVTEVTEVTQVTEVTEVTQVTEVTGKAKCIASSSHDPVLTHSQLPITTRSDQLPLLILPLAVRTNLLYNISSEQVFL